jgi:hypothetical protein
MGEQSRVWADNGGEHQTLPHLLLEAGRPGCPQYPQCQAVGHPLPREASLTHGFCQDGGATACAGLRVRGRFPLCLLPLPSLAQLEVLRELKVQGHTNNPSHFQLSPRLLWFGGLCSRRNGSVEACEANLLGVYQAFFKDVLNMES